MAFDFSAIIAEETKKQQENERTGTNSTGFKTVYPFSNGRLEFKFIGNEPSGLLYRELYFHEYYPNNKKQKVPCLHNMYGMDCPICNAVRNIQDTFEDSDVFRKYGFKKQGIMFAKLLNVTPDNYFGDSANPPKPGDIVIFMFPKSVITELRNLIIEFGDECDTLFTNNETRNVTLKIETQANGFPGYTFYVKNNSTTLCVDESGNPDQAAFNEFMANMPNLKEMKFPSAPTEDFMNIHKTIVEEINRKYFGENLNEVAKQDFATAAPMGQVSNTRNIKPLQVNNVNNISATPVENSPEFTSFSEMALNDALGTNNDSSDKEERPACFGNNEYNEKCSKCKWDAMCV